MSSFPSIGFFNNYPSKTTFIQWLRTRAYPPNGVMPSATFGNVTPVSGGNAPYSYSLDGNGFTFPIAMQFNGRTGRIAVPSAAQVTGNGITVSLWAKVTGNGNQAPRGIMYSQGSTYLDTCYSGHAMFSLATSTQVLAYSNSGCPPAGEWVNYVATYNGTYGQLYVNGVPGARVADSGNVAPGTIYIGQYASGSYNFNGSIADVQVYPVGLTANQVEQLYLNNSVSNGITPSSYWPLDGPLNGLYNETLEVASGNYGTLYGNAINSLMPCSPAAVLANLCGVSYTP